MQFLAAFLLAVSGGFISWVAQRFTKRFVAAAAFMTAWLVLLGALWLAMKALIAGLVMTVSNQYLIMGFWAIWPTNAEAVVSACIACDAAIFVYKTHVENLKAIAYST